MKTRKIIILLTACLMLTLAGCFPVAPASSPEQQTAAMNTLVAQIVASTEQAQTAAALGGNPSPTQEVNPPQDTQAIVSTNTPEPTATPSLTNTSLLTATPNFPRVYIAAVTNCRSGPGLVYDILGVIQAGETAEVVGQDSTGGSWIVRLPSNINVTCWIWRANATPVGPASGAPIFTNPPTPTPVQNFVLSFVEVVNCGADYAISLKIQNNGSVTWESNQVNLTDKTEGFTNTRNLDSFPTYDGCTIESESDNLEPGEVGQTISHAFTNNPSGDNFSVTVEVCSAEGLSGICMNKSITFKAP